MRYFAKKDIAARGRPNTRRRWLPPMRGGMDASLLELKIQDLGAAPAPPGESASVDTLNKAKP